MSRKKIIRAEDITEKDILSLYEGVLPLLYDNPEKLDLTQVLNKSLLGFVWYDFYHYLMDDPKEDNQRLYLYFENWRNSEINKKEFSNISANLRKLEDHDSFFEEKLEHSYQSAIAHNRADKPSKPKKYDYYRMTSKKDSGLGLGFFRYKYQNKNNEFSDSDIRIFEKLTPHILLLYRIILNRMLESRTFQYFDAFNTICSKIADDFILSNTELKLLPEILFGHSNEEIAKRNFVSPATVKKHLRSIFKKTKTKNRIDFIGKFFTSPDRVNIE